MLATKFKNFSLIQIPREDNVVADALDNIGSSLRIPPKTKILIIYIMTPIIEDLTAQDQAASITTIEDPDL